jgi:hypothetical protein
MSLQDAKNSYCRIDWKYLKGPRPESETIALALVSCKSYKPCNGSWPLHGTTSKLLRSCRTVPLKSPNLEENKKQIHGEIFVLKLKNPGRAQDALIREKYDHLLS